MSLATMAINQTGAIREFEKPEVCQAIKVANANKWTIGLSPAEWDEREARLKKGYGKNHIKRGDPIPCSPALKEAASQFNDALLDEQGKKIKRFGKEIARLNKIIRKKNLKIAEKDEVIADLGKELAEANKHQQQAYRSCADKNKEIRALKLQISALEKRGNGIDWKRNADAIKLYVNRASHERLWSPISQDICNEQELSFIINHGGKRVKYALRFDGTDIVYECSDPDKKPSFFRDDSVGAVSNQKDCSPVKDTHPTEDNSEEIEIEKAVKLVRKAMKEGCTVTIDYKD